MIRCDLCGRQGPRVPPPEWAIGTIRRFGAVVSCGYCCPDCFVNLNVDAFTASPKPQPPGAPS